MRCWPRPRSISTSVVSASLRVELRRQRAAHVGQRGEGADDQAHRRGDLLRVAAVAATGCASTANPCRPGCEMPSAGHSSRPTALTVSYSAASSPGSPQAAIQLADSLTRGQLDRRRQQVGDGLGHRHAARGRRVDGGQRRALAHAHRLAGEALVVGQRDGAIGHRHLPGADHLVAVAQAADGAVADGDQEALGGHGRDATARRSRPSAGRRR